MMAALVPETVVPVEAEAEAAARRSSARATIWSSPAVEEVPPTVAPEAMRIRLAEGPFLGLRETLNGPGESAEFGPHMSSSSGDGMIGGGGGVNDNAGGGGGYFGGGAGFAGGGGGGSSYPTPATEWDATATPSLTITTSDTISLHNAGTGRITCTALSGNTTSTITVSGCSGGNTGGSSVSMPATTLTGGGTINWLSGGSTTIGIPTLSATSATKCPGYARKGSQQSHRREVRSFGNRGYR